MEISLRNIADEVVQQYVEEQKGEPMHYDQFQVDSTF